jgi:hypothetical protein
LAQSGDTITFNAGLSGTISLLSSLPGGSTNDLTITAPIPGTVTINGNLTNSMFSFSRGVVSLSGLALAAGLSAIHNSGTLMVSNCTIGNCASGAMAVFNDGTMTVNNCRFAGNGGTPLWNNYQMALVNCTISDNSAVNSVGGVANYGTLSTTNCTIARNNSSSGDGGGLYNGGTMTIASCTIFGNSCAGVGARGGGIFSYGTLRVQNSIIASNSSASALGPDVFGTATSQGFNLIGATNGSTGWLAGDLTGSTSNRKDPMLGPLLDNGGATLTMLPLPGSPALDQGKAAGLTLDQRGQPRPYDNLGLTNALGGDGSDIGAVELGAGANPGTNAGITRVVTSLNNSGPGSLREVLGVSVSGDTILFAPGLAGTISLAGSLSIPRGNLAVIGSPTQSVTINGNGTSSIFSFFGGTAALSGLALVNAGGNYGPAINNSGSLVVSNCTISNCCCFAIFNSGPMAINQCRITANIDGIYNAGPMTINSSTISDNYRTDPSGSEGAGIFNLGTLAMTNCTVSGNSAPNGFGGGIYSGNNPLILSSCTIVSNSCNSGSGGQGGGLFVSNPNTVQIQNTIIANNTSSGSGPDVYGPAVASQGYNLIGATNGSSGWSVNDRVGSLLARLDPLLGPLQNNGGSSPTHALKSGSPAIDSGFGYGLAFDQRGQPRPYNNSGATNASGGDGSDIGAYEAIGPLITVLPQDQTVLNGQTATFSVAATSDAALVYQWRFNNLDILGATTSAYTRVNSQQADAGPYRVVLSNAFGNVTSAVAVLTVNVPAAIITPPQSQAVNLGSNVTFTVLAGGTLPLGYQWKFTGTNIPGSTGSSYTRTNAQLVDAGDYLVVVTNSFGSATSAIAFLTVMAPPAITTPPQSQTVNVGSNVTFAVGATGTSPLSYFWQFNGTNLPGATASSYSVSNAQTAQAGNYTVAVTNLYGSVTSAVAVLTVNLPPAITGQPPGRALYAGATTVFSVGATGTLPLRYQWQHGGTSISGATDSDYFRTNLQPADSGNYSVVVTNVAGAVTSSIAVLTVTFPPGSNVIAQWNFNGPVPDGVTATGTNTPSYGSGTASVVGGTAASFALGDAAVDPAGTNDNSGWLTTTYPVQGTSNKTAGVQFRVSTAGRENIRVSWSQFTSGVGSKYFRLQYTSNGADFVDVPTASVMTALGVYQPQTNHLDSLPTLDNNPDFTIRIVAEFESTAAGTTNANYVLVSGGGYGRGPTLFDMVTVYGEAINMAATLVSPVYTTNSQFLFSVTGRAGSNYVIQAATNLSAPNWLPVLTNAAPFTFVESNGVPRPQRFYRAVFLP